MRYSSCVVLALALLVSPAYGQGIIVPVQQLVFPHIAVGGEWETELYLVAGGEEPSEGKIFFVAQDGGDLMLRVNGGAPASKMNFSLGRNESASYLLTADAPTKAGWIYLDQFYAGMFGLGTIQGQVTYRQKSGSRVLSQVGIFSSPAVKETRLFYDNTGGNQSALAVATTIKTTIQVERYSLTGELQERNTIDLVEFGQKALYVEQLFPKSVNGKGVLRLIGKDYFFNTALNSRDGNWSGSASMGGVYERKVLVQLDTLYEWNLRLYQDGWLLYGIADLLAPAQADKVWSFTTGSLLGTSAGKTILQLNIHLPFSSGVTVNMNLFADVTNAGTAEITGKAYGLRDDGAFWKQGTFRMTAVKP